MLIYLMGRDDSVTYFLKDFQVVTDSITMQPMAVILQRYRRGMLKKVVGKFMKARECNEPKCRPCTMGAFTVTRSSTQMF